MPDDRFTEDELSDIEYCIKTTIKEYRKEFGVAEDECGKLFELLEKVRKM